VALSMLEPDCSKSKLSFLLFVWSFCGGGGGTKSAFCSSWSMVTAPTKMGKGDIHNGKRRREQKCRPFAAFAGGVERRGGKLSRSSFCFRRCDIKSHFDIFTQKVRWFSQDRDALY
jgi:hypothetical protein